MQVVSSSDDLCDALSGLSSCNSTPVKKQKKKKIQKQVRSGDATRWFKFPMPLPAQVKSKSKKITGMFFNISDGFHHGGAVPWYEWP